MTESEQLTEAWKKGKLPEDFYYVISDSEFIKICYVKQDSTDYIKLICSKVPSYKEYQAIKQWRAKGNKGTNYICAFLQENEELERRNTELHNLLHEVAKENTKLKELLKECRDVLLVDEMNATAHYKKALQGLLAKIKQVLGEE